MHSPRGSLLLFVTTAPVITPKWAWPIFVRCRSAHRPFSTTSPLLTSSSSASVSSETMAATTLTTTPSRILITGGTDGIGREAAMRLVEHRHDVTISGRDVQKAQRLIDDCRQKFNAEPKFMRADLSIAAEVRKFAAEVAEQKFDIFILNAGVMVPKKTLSSSTSSGVSDGDDVVDTTMMTNVVSSYMIAHKILDERRQKQKTCETPPIHFVFSTSILIKAHSFTPLGPFLFNPSKTGDWHKALASTGTTSGHSKYLYSKIGLATLATTIERLQMPGVTATSVHPGTVYTNIMSNLPARQQKYIQLSRRFTSSLEEAGANLIRAAATPLPVGSYWQADRRARLPDIVCSAASCRAFDDAFEQFRI